MTSRPNHKSLASLTIDEVDRLNRLIQNEKGQNLAGAIVQLFETKKNDNWIDIGTGILVFIKNNANKAYYFSLFNLKNKLWEQELFMPFEYKKVNQVFHIFSADKSNVGINFSFENEAAKFFEIVIKKVNEYNNKYEKIYKYMVDSCIRNQVIKTLKDCNCDINEENIQIVIDYKLMNGGFEPAVEQPSFDLTKEIPKYKPKPPIDPNFIQNPTPAIASNFSDLARKTPPIISKAPQILSPKLPSNPAFQVPTNGPPPPPNRKPPQVSYENPFKLNLKQIPNPPSYTPPPPPFPSKHQKQVSPDRMASYHNSIITEPKHSSIVNSSITHANDINPMPPNFKPPPPPPLLPQGNKVSRPPASTYENPLKRIQNNAENQNQGSGRDNLLKSIRDKNFKLKSVNKDGNTFKELPKNTKENSGFDYLIRKIKERGKYLANQGEYMTNDVDSDFDS